MNDIQVALLSALSGAGLYSGTRMLHNALERFENKPQDQYGVSGDKIVIKLPKKQDQNKPENAHQPQQASGIDFQHKYAEVTALTVPLGLASFIAGLYGANKLHDAYQKRNANKELEEAHNQYQQYLQQLQNQKTASETPHVDALCEKIAEEFEKKGSLFNPSTWFSIGNTTPDGHDIWENHKAHIPFISDTSKAAKGWFSDKWVQPALGIGATYMALKFLADRTKAKREEDAAARAKLPTQIVIDQS